MKRKPVTRTGLTLVELITASSMATVCILAVGLVFSDSQNAWNKTYTKSNSAIMLDSHNASKAFEAAVRKATCQKYLLDTTSGQWVEVYYFASAASTVPDRFAKFYVDNGTFYIDRGVISPLQVLDTTAVCDNVTEYLFSGSGRCVRLNMTLSKDNQSVTFNSSAIPQNQ
jgi:hypothetical protein